MEMNVYHWGLLYRKIRNYLINSIFLRKPKKYVSLDNVIIRRYNKTRSCSNTNLLCYAPFSNLYIGIDGKVGVCCYNRSYILGTYPNQTISEIWQGNLIRKLRDNISKADLSNGCYMCMLQWQEGVFNSVLAKDYDLLTINEMYPTSIEFELSNSCNLNCIMCSSWFSSSFQSNYSEFKEIYGKSFIQELKEFIPYLKRAKFLGGEPFFIPIYYEIWDEFIKLNSQCELIVTTNGTILNDNVKNLLVKGNFHIVVSIDSFQKETYSKIRKNANFNQTMRNLEYFIDLQKSRKKYIGIVTCFMQQNWEEIPDMIIFCNEKNIPIKFNKVWTPPECAIWHCEPDYLMKIINAYEKVKLPSHNFIQKSNKHAFNDLLSLTKSWYKQSLQNNQIKISAASSVEIDKLNDLFYKKMNDFFSENRKFKNQKDEFFCKAEMLFSKIKSQSQKQKLLEFLCKYPSVSIFQNVIGNNIDELFAKVEEILLKEKNF